MEDLERVRRDLVEAHIVLFAYRDYLNPPITDAFAVQRGLDPQKIEGTRAAARRRLSALQVDGDIEGDVQAAEVLVGEKGRVTGMVAGQQVVVRGTVLGVVCAQSVALQSSCITCLSRSSRARTSTVIADARRARLTS